MNRAMSDCEETDFFGELWMSPGKRKRKRKKDSKKSSKKDQTMKTGDTPRKKKKKNVQFKGVMEKRKAKEKDKKKNKNSTALELGDSLASTQALGAQVDLTLKPQTSNAHSHDRLRPNHLTPDCKTKRKKRVAFDLSPGYIRVKRPKFASSSLHCPKESIVLENEVVGHNDSPSKVPLTGPSQGPTQDDSQCNSEDMNSQDLFITQKTFRALSPEPSSGEASDQVITASPQVFTQQGLLHTAITQRKQHLERSGSCPHRAHVYQHLRKADKHATKPKPIHPAEEEGLNKRHHTQRNGKVSLQTQAEINASLAEMRKAPSAAYRKLAGPVVETQCHASSQQSTRSTSTQTENFFTTELSCFLNFIHKHRASSHLEHFKPLDLSLPRRNRKGLGTCSPMKISKLSGQIEGDKKPKSSSLHPSCSTDTEDVQVKKETPENKSETLSPESEWEPKSTSSEDNEPHCRSGKLDLTQVRQTSCSHTGLCIQQTSCVSLSAQAATFTSVFITLECSHAVLSNVHLKIHLNIMHPNIAVTYLRTPDLLLYTDTLDTKISHLQ